MRRQIESAADLDILVSTASVSSGDLNLCLDIGDDGACDFQHSGATTFPATFEVIDLAAAFNDYMLSAAVPWGEPVDVPVRLQVDRQADVMLTNLALTPVGAKTRFLRLPAEAYDEVNIALRFDQPGVTSGPLAFTVDVGIDGTVDWSYAGTENFPAVVTSVADDDLATAFNAYLNNRSGDVDVPIRIVPSPFVDTALVDFVTTPTATPDLAVASSDIGFGGGSVTEGEIIPVTATVHNTGDRDSGPLTASLYAALPDGREQYIGSAFVSNIAASGSTDATIQWDTLGFNGDVPVRVVVDPYNRVAEGDENNNEATANLTVLTRPDLSFSDFTVSDNEPVEGETITIAMTVANDGQTPVGTADVGVYDGHPDSGGALICSGTPSVAANGQSTVECPWTAGTPGLHRLYALADQGNSVNESNEGNNSRGQDVYVGLAGPLLLDSGGANDPPYTPQQGYGYVTGNPTTFCGTDPEHSQRTMGNGPVVYRFDHLLPGHFYHLDITLFECDGLGRVEQVEVDDNLISAEINLADGQVHRLSFLLDPAFYSDNSIVVNIAELTGNDAWVAEVNLHDIYYRYANAGGANDPQYSPSIGYGWLDGVDRQPWGNLPFQTRRIDEADSNPADDPDNELRYQFDGLDPSLQYQLHLTFYQGAGAVANQEVRIDGTATGTSVQVGAGQRVDVTVDVPPGAYAADGSIVAQVVRSTAANAFANEIAVEQRTVVEGAPPVPEIDVAPTTLTANQPPDTSTNQQFTISNLGDGSLTWTVSEATGSCGAPSDVGWVSVAPTSGSTPAAGSSNVTVTFNSLGLAPGAYSANLCVNSDDPDEPVVTVGVALTVQNAGNQPTLDIPDNIPGYPNQTVIVPIPFVSNGASIASLVFSLDFDQTCLAFDPADGDGDGLPDAVTITVPPAFNASVTYDAADSDGELDFFIADTFPPLSALPDGTPATIEFTVICQPGPGSSVTTSILFSNSPAASFGSTSGGSVPGIVSGGSVLVQTTQPGDCNADTLVDAGDITALVLEIFDGDGSDPAGAPGGTFPGSSVGCNSNQDAWIDAGDISCTVLTIFNGPNACGGSLNLEEQVQSRAPALILLEPKVDGDRVTVPIAFTPGDHQISSVVLALDYDPEVAGIDPTDGDANGIPDAIVFNLPPEFMAAVTVDSEAGRLQVMIADVSTPLAALPEQVIAAVTWQIKGGVLENANLRLSDTPSPTFGDVYGRAMPDAGNP